MRFNTLDEWLGWQETLHPSEIDLGLDRCRQVAQRMGIDKTQATVIVVAGTNGKGSSVAMLESIYHAAGLNTGSYTSPHLLHYNERIRVGQQPVSDEDLCAAFARVDEHRSDTPLTYFEFGTLAALELFSRRAVDIEILEIGLGGRLDAVNIRDADVALITSVGIDHTEWLGSDCDSIGHEKAGIMRAGRPVVIAELEPPGSLAEYANALDAKMIRLGHEFDFTEEHEGWEWCSRDKHLLDLPPPGLEGSVQRRNAAAVLAVIDRLDSTWRVSREHIDRGLQQVQLPGRRQRVGGVVPMLIDVAHNAQAIEGLASDLKLDPVAGTTHAVFAMLSDKDIEAAVRAAAPVIQYWHIAGLIGPRAVATEQLSDIVKSVDQTVPVECYDTVVAAIEGAKGRAQSGDRIVVFGSFFVVAEVVSQER